MAPKKKVPKAKDAGDIIKVFQAFDRKGDGMISREELGEVLKELDKSWTDRKLDLLMREIDTSKDGRIDYDEFVAWIMAGRSGDTKRQSVRQAAEQAARKASPAPAKGAAEKEEGKGSARATSSSDEVDEKLDPLLDELFLLYDLDEDEQMERIELLEGEEKRLGMDFGPKERKATIAWFKEAGAQGTPVDGMFLPKEKWKVAMRAKATEGAKEKQQKTSEWLKEEYAKLLDPQKKGSSSGGPEGAGGELSAELPKPPEYPLTFQFKELTEKIEEASRFNKNVLILTSDKGEVETFMNYRNFVLMDCKMYVSRVFALKNMSLEDAQAEAKQKLVLGMNTSGFCKPIHVRLNNSALDWERFCSEDGFPAEVFDKNLWTIEKAHQRGLFDSAHKFSLEVEEQKKWKEFQLVITSTFDLESAKSFLAGKIPHYDSLAVLVLDPASIT